MPATKAVSQGACTLESANFVTDSSMQPTAGATVLWSTALCLRHAAVSCCSSLSATLPAVYLRRKRVPNVAYGSGTHVCIGEYLSLVELECAFRGLFTRLPNLKVGNTRVVV